MVKDTHRHKFRLTRDVVIPAGTEVSMAASRTTRFVPFGSALIPMEGDPANSTLELSFDLEEAEQAGLIEPVRGEG
jgi:hypothetical protein